jgi:RND family efflux transporter MFP subunit
MAQGSASAIGRRAHVHGLEQPRRRPARRARAAAGALLAAALAAAPARASDPGQPLDCVMEPMARVVVSAPVSAVVEDVLVDRGDFVQRGQVIAKLESSVERATVEAARARAESVAELRASRAKLDFERRRSERARELADRGVVSDNDRDENESARLVAEAEWMRAQENQKIAGFELERARAVLGLREIKSPLDAVVVRRILSPGEYADPLDLIELAQIDPLRVEVFAPVDLLGAVEPGMRGEVTLEQPVGGTHEARVVVVDPLVDAASGTFGIRLELPNPERRLPAGLKCVVRFPDARPSGPAAANGPAPGAAVVGAEAAAAP